MVLPNKHPRTNVINAIGKRAMGSCHEINIADGVRHRNEINTPFTKALIFKVDVEIKNPAMIHMQKAEMLASQVSP